MRFAVLLPVVLIAGACAPGSTLSSLAPSPSGISFQYTHSYSTEYPATIQAANAHCGQFNKVARPVGPPVRLNLDRSVVTFECVASQD